MPKPAIEEFARVLIREVRDKAIKSCDMNLNPKANDAESIRWRKNIAELSVADFAKSIIPDCVDDAIFQLHYAIDNGKLPLSYAANDGTLVDLAKDGEGEMAGEYITLDGWRYTLSNQRASDDFAD